MTDPKSFSMMMIVVSSYTFGEYLQTEKDFIWCVGNSFLLYLGTLLVITIGEAMYKRLSGRHKSRDENTDEGKAAG